MTIKRLDTTEVYAFSRDPVTYPSFDYDQTITRHKLLDGSIKIDRAAHLIKEITFAWATIGRVEREKMEAWAKLACKMEVKWYDVDDHLHTDQGYMVLGASRGGRRAAKYDLAITLLVTAET